MARSDCLKNTNGQVTIIIQSISTPRKRNVYAFKAFIQIVRKIEVSWRYSNTMRFLYVHRYCKRKMFSIKMVYDPYLTLNKSPPQKQNIQFQILKTYKTFTTKQCSVSSLSTQINTTLSSSLWIVTSGTRCLCSQVINNEGYGYWILFE